VKIGIIGYGEIGRGLTEIITRGDAGDTEVAATLVRNEAAARDGGAVAPTADADAFLGGDFPLVVEAAGHAALRQYAERVLDAGKDLMAISVGAFADALFLDSVTAAAKRNGCHVLIPSGAIAGLDMISAAALAPIDSVLHTTRKHPRAFTAEQLDGRLPESEAVLLFDGPARDGVARFPENVNVAAAVSLAGVGLDRTRLRVFADPNVTRNQHEVEVQGYFGRVRIEVENIPTSNPKTGRIVALSIAKALRDQTAPFVIG
jgi:aspartate dehydrogenase